MRKQDTSTLEGRKTAESRTTGGPISAAPCGRSFRMGGGISIRFPKAFDMASQVCGEMMKNLKICLDDVEVGYLAMHLERVMDTELK
mgnify:CR=1 FL=1